MSGFPERSGVDTGLTAGIPWKNIFLPFPGGSFVTGVPAMEIVPDVGSSR